MLINSCELVPSIRGHKSKLFQDLLNHTKNRELTKQLWAVAQSRELLKNLGDLERDSNGEVTYDSLKRALNINELIEKSQVGYSDAMSLGLLDGNNHSIEYDSADTLMRKAIEYNDTHDNFVAIVSQKGNKFVATIETRDLDNLGEARKIKFKSALNNKLLSLINSLGFDISFSTDSKLQNVFNPLNAETNATSLKNVIRVSKGQLGEEAVPEEVSHLIIAGLKNHALYNRIASFYTPEMVKAVLGEQYDTYYELYKDGNIDVEEYLKDEAIGKVLAEMLKGEREKTTLFERLWNVAKTLFKEGSVEEIEKAIRDAWSATESLSTIVNDNPEQLRTILNNRDVMKARAFYQIVEQVDRLKEIAEQGEALLSKRLSLVRMGEADSIETSFSREAIMSARALLNKKQYAAACYSILDEIARQMTDIKETNDIVGVIRDDEDVDLERVNKAARQLLRVEQFNHAYTDYINTLQAIGTLVESGEVDLTEEDAEDIMGVASKVASAQNYLTQTIVPLRFNILKNLLTLFYGKEQLLNMRTDKAEAMSVEALLKQAENDIGAIDAFICSLGESRSPILSVVHEMVVRRQAARDRKLNDHVQYIQSITKRLNDAGYKTDFVYERDEEGIPTGFYIGPYQISKWYKDRDAEAKRLASLGLEDWRVKAQMKSWEASHMKTIIDEDNNQVIIPYFKGKDGNNIYESKSLDKLTDAQREYYEAIINLKKMQDEKLPLAGDLLFRTWMAPQMRADILDTIDFSNPLKSLEKYWAKLKSNFEKNEDTEEYGETVLSYDDNGVKYRVTDFQGKPIKRVPVYFTHMLKDLSVLNTDASQSMIAYIAMAENYVEMSKIADALILLNNYMKEDFTVKEKQGGKNIMSKFKAYEQEYISPVVIEGAKTRISKQLDEYLDRILFGIKQVDDGEIKIGNTYVSVNQLESVFKNYVSKLGIGLNVFSGLSNVTMGEAQMGLEAAAGQYFNFKELLWAHKEYDTLLPHLLGNLNTIQKTDKLSLLVNAFNGTEDFFRESKEKSYKKSAFRRIIGNSGWFFLQTAGEHKLHVTGMLAMLKHIKGTDGKSFYDSIKVDHDERTGEYGLSFNDFTIEMKGQPYLKFMEKYAIDGKVTVGDSNQEALNQFIENLNVYVNRVNAGMHGGYSDAEKGNINRTFLGRMLMQFRQWMPATYGKRFSRSYYDPIMQKTTEGYYVSYGRFLKELFLDAKRGEIAYKLHWNELSEEEKANVKRARSELLLFLALNVFARLTSGWKDKDRPWLVKMAKYQIERLKMETGAMIPWVTMPENFMQILNSPMAGTSAIQDVLDLFEIHHMFDVIEQGRYEGWTIWERDLLQALPYRNLVKAFDLKDENYIFNLFRDN